MLAVSRTRFGLTRLGICTQNVHRTSSSSAYRDDYEDELEDTTPALAELAKRKRKAEWKRRQAGNFLDHVIIQARGGKGGDGCVAFHREKFKPFGPPSGGNGARGGDVYVLPTPNLTSLASVTRRARAGAGSHGQGEWRHGRKGEDLIIRVPLGTVVRELVDGRKPKDHWELEEESFEGLSEEEAEMKRLDKRWVHYPMHEESNLDREDFKVAQKAIEREERARRREELANVREPMHLDLTHPMSSSLSTSQPCYTRHIDPEKGYLVASGGTGGYGNPYFLSSTNRSPKYATRGQEGERVALELELKLLADVGLVGLPNAGKSTLLRALTDSRAQVAPYAFTTLNPQVGIVRVWDDGSFGTRNTEPVFDSSEHAASVQVDSSAYKIKSVGGLHTEQTRFTIADNPGLIERASENVGLGHSFLKSIERSLVLVYVLDFSAAEPWSDLRVLHDELEMYQPGLPTRARLVVANKADLMPSANEAEVEAAWAKLRRLRDEVDAIAWDDGGQTGPIEVVAISGKFKQNLQLLVGKMMEHVKVARARLEKEQQQKLDEIDW
ncbi:unnamed protein product [Rhizoctonia solani]|uniref:GTPase n=1 Tax=Rhizoctonia solani TaxID=456999 RepID=A0A8H3D172_9AGAM|nr:unnamed protein product [Rhizoctonia solani]